MHSKCLEAFSAISWLPAANTRRAIKSIGPPKKKKKPCVALRHLLKCSHFHFKQDETLKATFLHIENSSGAVWRKGNRSFRYENSSSEIAQKFRSLQEKFAVENSWNILGEYSSFFKPSTWNYLLLDGINFYRNGFASKRPVTERTQKHWPSKTLSL